MPNNPTPPRRPAAIPGNLLPAELIPEVPRITLHGNSQVCVENHGGIKTYTCQCVEIKTRQGFLRISGDCLCLAAMTRKDIVVNGTVLSVEFC